MKMGIEVGLEMHNQIVWYLEFYMLVLESYCVRNRMILLSSPCGVAPSFVESVAVMHLIIGGTKDGVSMILQYFRLA